MSRLDLSIDRITRSRRNLFTSVRLDRLVEFRDDPEWVRQALTARATRLVPLWRNRNLLTTAGSSQQALYLRPGDLDLGRAAQRPTLLGTDGEHCFFAVAVSDSQRETLLAAHPGARFLDLRLASLDMDAKHAGVLAYAKALLYWQYRHAFCGACGSPNRLEAAGHKLVCSKEDCARQSFPRIDPAIIVLVTNGDACMLGHNTAWPPRRFSTLAGFVEPGESLEDAVVREVFEESGVRLGRIRYESSQPWPFPSSAMCGFYAEALSRECTPSAEMQELRWLDAEQIDASIAADEIRLPPPVSIAFRLIADWYHDVCGRDLEPLVRAGGSWRSRKE
jgi:NAD+ diphosphatase